MNENKDKHTYILDLYYQLKLNSVSTCEKVIKELDKFNQLFVHLIRILDINYLQYIYKTYLQTFGEDLADNGSLLDKYLVRFDFTNTDIVLALRQFLGSFKLPGEGQKVARIIEKFSEKYVKDTKFKDELPFLQEPDNVYRLFFSIVMLNTDAHNTSIKKKMTKEEFIDNYSKTLTNYTLNNLERDLFKKIYQDINQTPLKLT